MVVRTTGNSACLYAPTLVAQNEFDDPAECLDYRTRVLSSYDISQVVDTPTPLFLGFQIWVVEADLMEPERGAQRRYCSVVRGLKAQVRMLDVLDNIAIVTRRGYSKRSVIHGTACGMCARSTSKVMLR